MLVKMMGVIEKHYFTGIRNVRVAMVYYGNFTIF
jgi:hypothetical protein